MPTSVKSTRSSLKRSMKKDKESQSDVPNKRISITRPEIQHTFLSHEQVNQYLKFIDSRYSQFVKLHTIGLSYEHREIKALEINWNSPKNTYNTENQSTDPNKSTRNSKHLQRRIVFIEAGAHAREWITISVALSCIYQLTENYKRHLDLLRKLKFFIVPVVNPDGYEYSRLKNRKWRKNRRPHRNSSFVGTDCNRNYDFQWEQGNTKMSYCTYKGEKPFSEPETRAMRDILAKLGPQILFFLSLHSCGQSIMYPWGYSRDEIPLHQKELEELALAGKNAILSCNGREYRVGSISNLINHCVSGSVVDYAHGHVKIPLALVMELPSRSLGFQPPKEMISPLGYESWHGIREMCRCAYMMGVCWDNQGCIIECEKSTSDLILQCNSSAMLNKCERRASANNLQLKRSLEERLAQQQKELSALFPTKHYAYLNKRKNHLFKPQQKELLRTDLKSAPPRVYDLPINAVCNRLGTYKLG